MQSRTSLRTASLLVRVAINELLNTFPIMLPNVGICGLGVSGLRILDDCGFWCRKSRGFTRWAGGITESKPKTWRLERHINFVYWVHVRIINCLMKFDMRFWDKMRPLNFRVRLSKRQGFHSCRLIFGKKLWMSITWQKIRCTKSDFSPRGILYIVYEQRMRKMMWILLSECSVNWYLRRGVCIFRIACKVFGFLMDFALQWTSEVNSFVSECQMC